MVRTGNRHLNSYKKTDCRDCKRGSLFFGFFQRLFSYFFFGSFFSTMAVLLGKYTWKPSLPSAFFFAV